MDWYTVNQLVDCLLKNYRGQGTCAMGANDLSALYVFIGSVTIRLDCRTNLVTVTIAGEVFGEPLPGDGITAEQIIHVVDQALAQTSS